MINQFLQNIRTVYNDNPLFIKTLIIFSFFVAFLINAPFLNVVLDNKYEIVNFKDHIISNATLNNLDISSRVKSYYSVFAKLIICSIFIFLLCLKLIKNKFNNSEESQKVLKNISQISCIGIAALLSNLFLIQLDIAVLFLLFLSCYYLFSSRKKNSLLIYNGLWILIISIPFSFLFYRVLTSNNLLHLLPKTILDTQINLEEVVFFMIFSVIAFIVNFLLNKVTNKETETLTLRHKNLYLSTLPISFILIIFSLSIEFFNIMNLRFGYVFDKPLMLFGIISAIAVIISILIFTNFNKTTKNISSNPIKKYHFPLLLIGLSLVYSQPWRFIFPENEFFEMANHGISVDHFFRYGSIPIVETFDAHMLSNQLFAYIYGFLNGYEPWSPFLYTSYISVFSFLLLFYIIKKFTGTTLAFIVVLTFPMLGSLNSQYLFSGIVALALLNIFQNKSKRSFYLFWGSIIFVCFYRLDLGFSAAIGSIVAYFIIHFITKKEYYFKSFFLTGAISTSIIFGLFIVLCLIKGINPVNRFTEFIIISMSNQNWAFASVGDSNLTVFRLTYYVLPLIIIYLFLKVILKSILIKGFIQQILQNKQSTSALIFFIFFTLFFYFNIPRGIVRHSLISNIILTSLSTIPVALMCYVYIFKREKNFIYFLILLIFTNFITQINIPSLKETDRSLISKSFNSSSFNEKFQPAIAFNNTRLKESFSFGEIKYFKQILDKVLNKDETYFDFSSMNYYYALTERKNPIYVNQSPLLINGDKSQNITLDEIRKVNPPLVLMPTEENIWRNIDGIPVEYKYYKIAEYIYKNYTPLLTLSKFTIYVHNNKKLEYQSKLDNVGSHNFILSDFSKIDLNSIQKQDLLIEKDQNNHLKLISNGADPFFFGIYKTNSTDSNSPQTIKLNFDTSQTGSVQVFYMLKGDDTFKEENSKRIEITKEGNYDFVIDVPTSIQDIRIDLEIPSITLKEFSVIEKKINSNNLLNNVAPLSYNLGEIPMVWGNNNSDKNLFNSIPALKTGLTQNTILMSLNLKNNEKKKPYYLLIEMESDTIQAATVELLNSQNTKTVDYLFRVNPGKNNYAIRLSANQNWWNQTTSKINMITERNVKITKFAAFSEDKTSMFFYNDNDVTLSNITDANWEGGVSTVNPNLILFDNSPRLLNLLKKSRVIKLQNNSILNISTYKIYGNYIHVEIKELNTSNKSLLSYPNNLKMDQ